MVNGPHTFDDIIDWCNINSKWIKTFDELNPHMRPMIVDRAEWYMERKLTDSEKMELMLRYA